MRMIQKSKLRMLSILWLNRQGQTQTFAKHFPDVVDDAGQFWISPEAIRAVLAFNQIPIKAITSITGIETTNLIIDEYDDTESLAQETETAAKLLVAVAEDSLK